MGEKGKRRKEKREKVNGQFICRSGRKFAKDVTLLRLISLQYSMRQAGVNLHPKPAALHMQGVLSFSWHEDTDHQMDGIVGVLISPNSRSRFGGLNHPQRCGIYPLGCDHRTRPMPDTILPLG